MWPDKKAKFANTPSATTIAIYGLDAEGYLMAEYRGDINSPPTMISLLKFANCAQLLVEDSDHKFIRIK